ncbi:MAG: metalloregulator ArsR/SmtB family transcription factor [Chloroflexi bacterium]|nr:metalloregulator ArsR/SmtB family transcription factor [Chloroflexota bacterium]MCL5949314.1 metalloregulator ArsR/SmtB family transcription factor [Candidatus Bathyarchaeota archaeon]
MSKTEFDMTIYELQAEISKTLAHPLRLAILHNLKGGEKTVNELIQTLGASQSNISQHLAILRQRQIVKTRKDGSNIYYRVASPKISQACDMVREVLLEQLSQKQEMARTYSK